MIFHLCALLANVKVLVDKVIDWVISEKLQTVSKKLQKPGRTDLDSFFTLPVEFKAHPDPITKPVCFHLGHCRCPNFGDLVIFEEGVDFILRRLLPIFSGNVDGAY